MSPRIYTKPRSWGQRGSSAEATRSVAGSEDTGWLLGHPHVYPACLARRAEQEQVQKKYLYPELLKSSLALDSGKPQAMSFPVILWESWWAVGRRCQIKTNNDTMQSFIEYFTLLFIMDGIFIHLTNSYWPFTGCLALL